MRGGERREPGLERPASPPATPPPSFLSQRPPLPPSCVEKAARAAAARHVAAQRGSGVGEELRAAPLEPPPWRGDGGRVRCRSVPLGVTGGAEPRPPRARPCGLAFHNRLEAGGSGRPERVHAARRRPAPCISSAAPSAGPRSPALHGLCRKTPALPEKVLASGLEGGKVGFTSAKQRCLPCALWGLVLSRLGAPSEVSRGGLGGHRVN